MWENFDTDTYYTSDVGLAAYTNAKAEGYAVFELADSQSYLLGSSVYILSP